MSTWQNLSVWWKTLRLVWRIIHKTRFSLFILVLAGLALLFNAQVQDLLSGLGSPTYQVVLFFFAVTWWSMQSWGWARYILNVEYGQERDSKEGVKRFLIDHLPRVYGLLSTVVAALAAFTADAEVIGYFLLALSVALYFFYMKRRALALKLPDAMIKHSRNKMALVSYAVLIIFSIFAVYDPVIMGRLLGPGAVVFLGLGSVIPIGTLLVKKSLRVDFPIIAFLIIVIVFFSLFNDNHKVRVIEAENGTSKQASQDISLPKAYTIWRKQFADEDPENLAPLVVVATAGGGLRATYWTDVVLGKLEQEIDGFHKHVFAISGVSGGSLGAVFYNAAIRAGADCPQDKSKNCFYRKLLDVAGQDYLSPVATAMLYGDLFQRFWPVPPSLAFLQFADRAQALERGWEYGFAKVFGKQAHYSLNMAFRELYDFHSATAHENWLPLLFLNGTMQESGQRIISSPVAIDPEIFLDSYDYYKLNGNRAIRASTAAHNSARFTYVSPAGTILDNDKKIGHILDGGYFENYGAATLENVINGLGKAFSDNSRPLIVIAISNDIEIERQQYKLSDPQQPNFKPGRFMNEVRAPLKGLLQVRSAHGLLAYKSLMQKVDQYEDHTFVHFSLDSLENLQKKNIDTKYYIDPPLGWVLSAPSKKNMQDQINIVKENSCAFDQVRSRLEAYKGNSQWVSPCE